MSDTIDCGKILSTELVYKYYGVEWVIFGAEPYSRDTLQILYNDGVFRKMGKFSYKFFQNKESKLTPVEQEICILVQQDKWC